MEQADEKELEPTRPGRLGHWILAGIILAGFRAYLDQRASPPRPLHPSAAISSSTLLPPGPLDSRPRFTNLRRPDPQPATARVSPIHRPVDPGIGRTIAAPTRPLLPPPDASFEIMTAAEVDERLFLMRALETLYESWPIASGDGAALDAAIAAMRHEATRHQLYIQERGIEGRIASLYGDLVALLDTYAECLAQAGRIERGGDARVRQERLEAMAASSFSGGVMAGQARNNGSSGGEALITWAWMTVIGTLAREVANAPARDEVKRAAVEANVREFSTRYSQAVANAESVALALSDRYGWARGEAGFDTAPEQSRQVLDMAARGDTSGLLRLVEIAKARRPRDPFVRSVAAFQKALALGPAATPDALAQGSDECLAAASLVPKGAFYDTYRADCLALAGLLANNAALSELGARGWIASPADRGPHALSIWKTYLACAPQDPTGEAREQLAWALASTRKFAEAATTAAQVTGLRGNDPNFAYCYARLLSLTDQSSESLRWLEHAFRDCRYPDILRAKSDPDLAMVRSSQATGFGKLAAVKFTWSIDWGFFHHDDLCLVNNSPFPLTDVRLNAMVDSQGSVRWTKILTAERVEPGATYRWKTWVSARGKDATGKATLTCDQQQ